MQGRMLRYARGTVWEVDLAGVETEEGVQSGNRPAVIVSNDYGNLTNKSVMIALISSREEKSKYPINVLFYNEFNEGNVVLCNQIRTISTRKLRKYKGVLCADTMSEVDKAMALAFGMKEKSESIEKLEDTVNKIIDRYKDIEGKAEDITAEQVAKIASKLEELFTGVVIPLDKVVKAAPVLTAYCEADKEKKEINADSTGNKSVTSKNEQGKPKRARKPHGFWTSERKRELLRDKESMSMQEIRDKWQIDNPKSLYQMCYAFRGELDERKDKSK